MLNPIYRSCGEGGLPHYFDNTFFLVLHFMFSWFLNDGCAVGDEGTLNLPHTINQGGGENWARLLEPAH